METVDTIEDEEENEESGGENDDLELTADQLKLLYLLSRYSHASTAAGEREEWIRKVPLMVLVYEGVVAQVLDYDYAPASEMIQTRRIYFNTSQEGRNDIDVLRELNLVNALKLSSKEHQAVTAYQISFKGSKYLEFLCIEDRQDVDSFIYAPSMESVIGDRGNAPHAEEDLLKVVWDDEAFVLRSESGYERESTVTDTEDVSYVSSPYLPMCLRHGGQENTSNADKAHLSATGDANIRDELDEVLVLNDVNVMVGEFIPCGANHIQSLNMKLGSTERVQGGFFTALVDDDSSGTKFEVPPGLTKVTILDYAVTGYINLEADIYFPEDQGIVQVENFGIHIGADGTICYGMKIEAVMDRVKDNISLDHLARLLVDVHQDSSRVTDSILSTYQLNLLDLVFLGDRNSRDKVNIITADNIVPKMTADKYMDRGPCENELKQVLGETRFAFDVSDEDVIIFGSHGILLCGPNAKKYEPTLVAYLSLTGKDIFVQNLFTRVYITLDSLTKIRELIMNAHQDPNAVTKVRNLLAGESRDVICFDETLGYAKESLDNMKIPTPPTEKAGKKLFELLDISRLRHELMSRVKDMEKNTQCTHTEMGILRQMSVHMKEQRMFKLQKTLNTNTSAVADTIEATSSRSTQLAMIQVILAGTLAFAILDRFSGMWTVTNREWSVGFAEGLLDAGFIWMILNMLFWTGICKLLKQYVFYKQGIAGKVMDVKLILNQQCDLDNMVRYLSEKNVTKSDALEADYGSLQRIKWTESKSKKHLWGGATPDIFLEYDERHGFLSYISMHYNKDEGTFSPKALRDSIMIELLDAGVLREPEPEEGDEEYEERRESEEM